MKATILTALIILPILFLAQTSRFQAEPLKLEWQKTLPGGYPSVSGLQLLNDKIYITQTGDDEGSAFSIVNPSGEVAFSSANYARIRSLFVYENAIYTMGDERLTKRDPAGTITDEKILSLDGKGNISCKNGKILNGSVYTTNIYSYFLKYSLTGDQTFKKTIGSSDNHLLDIGGNYIYLYSSVFTSNPGSRLLQYDTLGNEKWSMGIGRLVYGIYADNAGYCYMLTSETQGIGHVEKYDAEGNLVYDVKLPGQRGTDAFSLGDSLFICGQVSAAVRVDGQKMAAFCVLSAKTGIVYHQQTIDLDPDVSNLEDFTQIVSDGKNIYVGGYYGGQSKTNVLIKYSREGNTTGLKDDKVSRSSFNVFPNPGGSKFTITCENNQSSTANVTVRNISGQVVYKKEITCNADKSFTLDLGKQAAGNYNVEIVAGDQRTVKKIVIN